MTRETPNARSLVPRHSRSHRACVGGSSSARQAAARFEGNLAAAIKLVRQARETGRTGPAHLGGHRRAILDAHATLVLSTLDSKADITWVEIQADCTGAALWRE
jgi:transposase